MENFGLSYSEDYASISTMAVTKEYVDNAIWVDDKEEREKVEKVRDRKSKIKSILIEILRDKVKTLEEDNKAIWNEIKAIKEKL